MNTASPVRASSDLEEQLKDFPGCLKDPRDDRLDLEPYIEQRQSTSFTQTQITRLGNSGNKQQRYLMSLQLGEEDRPVLIAEKDHSTKTSFIEKRASSYAIRSVDNDAVIGSLVRTFHTRDSSTVTYTLFDKLHDMELAYIRYEVPSMMKVLSDCPPRRAFVEIPGRGYAETNEPTIINGKKTLNFNGRGREASCKNMQIGAKNGKVLLQFVKWSDQHFHLDFR